MALKTLHLSPTGLAVAEHARRTLVWRHPPDTHMGFNKARGTPPRSFIFPLSKLEPYCCPCLLLYLYLYNSVFPLSILLLLFCMCPFEHCTWRSEDNFLELISFLHLCVFIFRFEVQMFYWLSHITSPDLKILETELKGIGRNIKKQIERRVGPTLSVKIQV